MLLPALSRAKQKAQGIQCLNNLRQLGLAWVMSADDNQGRLAPCSAAGHSSRKSPDLPSWVGGAMDFTSDLDNINTGLLIDDATYPYAAKLGSYLKNPAVFRCPGDKSQVKIFGKLLNRVRSYSMNNYMGDYGIDPNQDIGFWFDSQYRLFLSYDDLVNAGPSKFFVLIDEREDSINEGIFGTVMAEDAMRDCPASYHGESGALAFKDGHSELHRWIDPRTRPPKEEWGKLDQLVPMPGNVDIDWLQAHTSVPK